MSGELWLIIKDSRPLRLFRLKNIHLANNLIARPDGTNLDLSLLLADGVALTELSSTNGSGSWLEELEGNLGDGTQWWDADNIWLPNQTFKVDDSVYSPSGWNNIFENDGANADLAVYYEGIKVDGNYKPIGNKSAIGSRSIVGSPAMQVAAWDFYGNERPESGAQAGAVQEHVPGNRMRPDPPNFPY